MTGTPLDDRRRELAATENPRAGITRARIVAAFAALLAEGEAASVSALCSRAGVARSTFYTHFADTHDVVAFVIDELFDELGVADVQRRASHALSRRESTEIGMREFFKGLENRRLFVLRSLSAPASVQVRERLTARMASTLGSTILTERPNSDHRYLEVSSRYISSGVLGVVLGWLEDPADLTSDELIALVIDLLPDWLTEGAP